jgi:DNA polymerase III psi subunit
MKKGFKVLQDSISVSIDNLKFVAENTTGSNGLLLNSVIKTLQTQKKVIEYLSNCLDNEMAIKNRCFDFLCKKGLMNEFYSK